MVRDVQATPSQAVRVAAGDDLPVGNGNTLSDGSHGRKDRTGAQTCEIGFQAVIDGRGAPCSSPTANAVGYHVSPLPRLKDLGILR